MAEELIFFDTNVLIAGSLPEHPHHSRSLLRLSSLQKGGGACASHTLAEAYNTLTKYPKGYGMDAAAAMVIVKHAAKTYRPISLSSSETARAIEEIAHRGLCGSIVYDALLMACARKVGASVIYTYNMRHMRQVAPDLASRIFEP